MPIPTRSQSVSKRVESGLPTRKQPVREAQTNTSGGHNAAIQQVDQGSGGAADQVASSNIPHTRGLARTNIESTKPSTHSRAASVNHATKSAIRKPSLRVNNSSTAEIKKPIGLRQPSVALSGKPQSRMQTRSTASNTAQTVDTITTKLHKAGSISHKDTRPAGPVRATGRASAEIPDHSIDQDTTDTRCRDELLQLQILHTSSIETQASYAHSVEEMKVVEARSIGSQQDEIMLLERSHRQVVSSTALHSWLSENSEYSDEQQIHVLSTAIAELDRYTSDTDLLRPLRQFELWLSETMTIRENRQAHVDPELRFVSALEATWRADMYQLQGDVSRVLSVLGHLHPAMADGGLGILLQKHTAFAKLILQEIEAAISLESTLVEAESQITAQMLERALQNLSEVESREKSEARVGTWMQ